MTTMLFHDELASPKARATRGAFARAREAIAAFLATRRKRREERITLGELSRFDERRLRDLGIEPMDMRDALHGKRSASALFEPMRRDGER
jgi:uncharacterized protein YjiS (DUF1127 family)